MSILKRLEAGIRTSSAEETEAVATELAAALPVDCTLALYGDLGCGKTTFVKGLARAWNIVEPVTSPTFNLFTLYRGDRALAHLDAYRLRGADDMDALMVEEFLSSPWCVVVEWPTRIEEWLPEDVFRLELRDCGMDLREIVLRR